MGSMLACQSLCMPVSLSAAALSTSSQHTDVYFYVFWWLDV